VARRLREAGPAQLRLVVAHHPVRAAVDRDRANLMHGRDAAVAAWLDAGADLLLGGHIHLPYVRPLHAPGPAPRRLWAVQAGTAVSRRVRDGAPNSVNLISCAARAAGRTCVVERWDCAGGGRPFERAQRHELALGAAASAATAGHG